jgi:hypothetical protein
MHAPGISQSALTLDPELLGLKEAAAKGASGPNRRRYRRLHDTEKPPRRDQHALLRMMDAFLSRAS